MSDPTLDLDLIERFALAANDEGQKMPDSLWLARQEAFHNAVYPAVVLELIQRLRAADQQKKATT